MPKLSTLCRIAILSALAAAVAARAEALDTQQLLGFDAAGSAAQRALETRFDAALPSPGELRAWMERLAAHPHHVGSPWGKANAEWMRDLFASWGYDARIETFDVLFPTPTRRELELTAPVRYRAKLEEPVLAQDRTSKQRAELLPTYNAYSVDGDVEGELVYVNQGLPADYETLATRGIDVRGKIVLARYGGSWRGIKPKVAAEKGAIGCIIFSDPTGDGYVQGDPYPKGGWRSRDAVQRGSVADMPLYSGDPATPGRAALPGAERLPLSETPTLTRIPVLPISYGDAEPLLAALGGPMAPESWRGGLPLPYHLGPGPARVHLAVAFDWSLRPVHDVIATLAGSERPEQTIVRGNHHDAWVSGALDPVSGMVSLLAEAKAVGEIARAGFRPRRTLVFAAWDGEEAGLLGSTEWAEAHESELASGAVAYLNTDSISRGFLGLAGSHSLERFANEAARDVTDPETGVSIFERSRAKAIADAPVEKRSTLRAAADLELEALGSGSDFTPFLQHVGVASLNVGFGGEEQYGQYHSIYDSVDHFVRFVDPEFTYVATAPRLDGRLLLRLAEAPVLPFTLDRVAERLSGYAKELGELAAKLRGEAEERARLLADRTLVLAADPKEVFVPPPPLDPVPFLELAALDNAVARLGRSAEAFEAARAAAESSGLSPGELSALNEFLRSFESRLTHADGLAGRPWYRHYVYAPGQYTGYGVKTLPSIREAIELRQWEAANREAATVAASLAGVADAIDAMTARLRGPAAGSGGS